MVPKFTLVRSFGLSVGLGALGGLVLLGAAPAPGFARDFAGGGGGFRGGGGGGGLVGAVFLVGFRVGDLRPAVLVEVGAVATASVAAAPLPGRRNGWLSPDWMLQGRPIAPPPGWLPARPG